jgi:hypothetical protein
LKDAVVADSEYARRVAGTYSRFPGGAPGAGLFLLRLSLTLVAGVQAWCYSGRPYAAMDSALAVGFILAGVANLLGFHSSLAAVAITLASVIAGVAGEPSLFAQFPARIAAVLTFAIACSCTALGPGAFSLDARVHGRKKIVIQTVKHPKQPES